MIAASLPFAYLDIRLASGAGIMRIKADGVCCFLPGSGVGTPDSKMCAIRYFGGHAHVEFQDTFALPCWALLEVWK